MNERGVLYIAFGKKGFIQEMLFSAESVRKHCPNMHISVFSDREIKSEFINHCEVIDIEHIRGKVDFIQLTPYKETIFLDTDTVVDHDISEMFDILQRYDFAICHDLGRKRENVSNIIPEYKKIPYMFSEVNPGVMVFRGSDDVNALFELWKKYFYKYFEVWPYEQPTFRVALWESGLDFYIMPPEYNIRSKMNGQKSKYFRHLFGKDHLKPRIFHMHADDIYHGKYNVKSVDEVLAFAKKNCMEY